MKRGEQLQQLLILATMLGILWVLLSGHYTPLLLGLGAVSVLTCVLLARHLQLADDEMRFSQFNLPAVLLYSLWLVKEIILACLDVTHRILDPRLPISPVMIRLPVSQKTDMGRTIYANSITLTPGTISVDLGDDFVEVHALSEEAAEGLAGGEMNARVRALERGN